MCVQSISTSFSFKEMEDAGAYHTEFRNSKEESDSEVHSVDGKAELKDLEVEVECISDDGEVEVECTSQRLGVLPTRLLHMSTKKLRERAPAKATSKSFWDPSLEEEECVQLRSFKALDSTHQESCSIFDLCHERTPTRDEYFHNKLLRKALANIRLAFPCREAARFVRVQDRFGGDECFHKLRLYSAVRSGVTPKRGFRIWVACDPDDCIVGVKAVGHVLPRTRSDKWRHERLFGEEDEMILFVPAYISPDVTDDELMEDTEFGMHIDAYVYTDTIADAQCSTATSTLGERYVEAVIKYHKGCWNTPRAYLHPGCARIVKNSFPSASTR